MHFFRADYIFLNYTLSKQIYFQFNKINENASFIEYFFLLFLANVDIMFESNCIVVVIYWRSVKFELPQQFSLHIIFFFDKNCTTALKYFRMTFYMYIYKVIFQTIIHKTNFVLLSFFFRSKLWFHYGWVKQRLSWPLF